MGQHVGVGRRGDWSRPSSFSLSSWDETRSSVKTRQRRLAKEREKERGCQGRSFSLHKRQKGYCCYQPKGTLESLPSSKVKTVQDGPSALNPEKQPVVTQKAENGLDPGNQSVDVLCKIVLGNTSDFEMKLSIRNDDENIRTENIPVQCTCCV